MKNTNTLKFLSICLICFIAAVALASKPFPKQNSKLITNNKFPLSDQNENEDSSGFSSDGPVIVYEDGNIVSYSVKPDENTFKVFRNPINSKDKLTCYVDETIEQFSFRLKESIDIEKEVYELPDKMLVISDIEGNFKGFTMILKGTGIINEELEWIFGKGHLVLAGDFFDRGLNVTECLWLIYKLEAEAEKQGGKVHFILGNHEMMNLKGDYRYVRTKYIANADSMNLSYDKWYAENSELGKWLRSKNSVEKIGDYLFLHAGISKDFPTETYSLTDINNNIRSTIEKSFPEGKTSKDIFIGSGGPLWYRGIVKETETQEDIEKTLAAFNSSKMIAGHTIVDRITYLYNSRVIAIDLDHQENADNGIMYALWFENGNFFVTDNNGIKTEIR